MRYAFMSFTSTNDYGHKVLKDKSNANAYKWWYFHGEIYQQLQLVAIKILSQVHS